MPIGTTDSLHHDASDASSIMERIRTGAMCARTRLYAKSRQMRHR